MLIRACGATPSPRTRRAATRDRDGRYWDNVFDSDPGDRGAQAARALGRGAPKRLWWVISSSA